MHKYKIIYKSMWTAPQIFYAYNESERDDLILQGKNDQYIVEWEEISPINLDNL